MCSMLRCVQLFTTPGTVACQAPLPMGFSRQEYWSGLPFPPPGDLPDPGIELEPHALAGRLFTTVPPAEYLWQPCPDHRGRVRESSAASLHILSGQCRKAATFSAINWRRARGTGAQPCHQVWAPSRDPWDTGKLDYAMRIPWRAVFSSKKISDSWTTQEWWPCPGLGPSWF